MDIAEKILKTIDEEKITPQPRWHFLLKDYFLWGSFAASVLIGAMAMSAVIFMLVDPDWDIYEYLDRSLFEHIFLSMPYLWIAILVALTTIAYYNFKYTRRGYRYEMRTIILGSIFISIIGGSLLYFAGLGGRIHEIFMQEVPLYHDLIYDKEDIWNNPEKGLLSGEIIGMGSEEGFSLRDFRGNIWQVKKEEGLQCGEGCFNPALLKNGAQIKLIGHIEGENIFFAKEIRNWCGR